MYTTKISIDKQPYKSLDVLIIAKNENQIVNSILEQINNFHKLYGFFKDNNETTNQAEEHMKFLVRRLEYLLDYIENLNFETSLDRKIYEMLRRG